MPYGDDADALRAAVTEETALVIIEPVQGENGVRRPPEGYLQAARELTRGHGTLLVLDEVQTGIGRTGHWFAHQGRASCPTRHARQGARRGLPLGATSRSATRPGC